jgi:hypothetical protein
MRRRTPAPLSAQQMIQDYLVRVSAAAQKVLPKGDRLLFVGRTRATIEAQVGPIASADADEVAAVLGALGDPEERAKQERERLYSARRRGAAAQPAKLWKPDKPSKPDRAARRDTKPLPRTRRPRGSGSRLIRRYGPWPGEPEASGGAPAGGTPTGGTPTGKAGRGPETGGPAPADAPLVDSQDTGQQAPDGPAGGGHGPDGQADGGPAGGGQGTGGQALGGRDAGQQAAGGPVVVAGPDGQVPRGPQSRQPAPVQTKPAQPQPAWPVIGPGASRPSDGRGPADGSEPAQDGAPADADGSAQASTPTRLAAADDTQPSSIVPGMEPAEEDEPLGGKKLGRPEPLTEAWAFVRRQPLESVALLLVGVGGLIYPFPLWLIGAVVSVRSRRWDKRDKWLAFTGPVLFTIAALIVMGITGPGNFFVAFGHATHHFGVLLRAGSLLCAGYLVWRLRRGPRRRRVPPWQRVR